MALSSDKVRWMPCMVASWREWNWSCRWWWIVYTVLGCALRCRIYLGLNLIASSSTGTTCRLDSDIKVSGASTNGRIWYWFWTGAVA